MLVFASYQVKGQDRLTINKDSIIGRWIEYNPADSVDNDIVTFPDNYIFRDTGIFHKGEAAEGVILFNITGRYTIQGNSIIILYRDYIQDKASKQDAKKLIFEILNISEKEMHVMVKDYDFEYEMILKR